jgi:RsmE family RNA methyltransferase
VKYSPKYSHTWHGFCDLIPTDLSKDSLFFPLVPSEIQYFSQVLRLRSGDHINLTDTKGSVVKLEISSMDKSGIQGKMITHSFRERPSDLTLVIPMPKKDAIEEVLRVCGYYAATLVILNMNEPVPERWSKILQEQLRISKGVWKSSIVTFPSLEAYLLDAYEHKKSLGLAVEPDLWKESFLKNNTENVFLNPLKDLLIKSPIKTFLIGNESGWNPEHRKIFSIFQEKDPNFITPFHLGDITFRVADAAHYVSHVFHALNHSKPLEL